MMELREVKTGSSKQQAILPVKRIRKNWSGIRRRSVSLLHLNETMILEDERNFFFLFQMLEGTDSLLDRHHACGKEVRGHEDYV